MPNWAYGTVQVKSDKPENIEKFCKYFIFSDEVGTKEAPYFARSFIEMTWEEFKKEHLGLTEAEFSVQFAWSASCCLINGYPQDHPELHPNFQDLCKELEVDVFIKTEEGMMGFEEEIHCGIEGHLEEESFDFEPYKCSKCGNEQHYPRDPCLDDEQCYECEEVGTLVKVEVKENDDINRS